MPPKYFPSDHQLPSNISTNNGSVHMSRQSEPLPYPPNMNSYNRLVPFPAGSRYSGNVSQGRFPTSNLHANPGMESKEDNVAGVHQFDYALLQQPPIRPGYPSVYQSSENSFGLNEGSMFSEGRIPSYQEADMLFNPNDTTNHSFLSAIVLYICKSSPIMHPITFGCVCACSYSKCWSNALAASGPQSCLQEWRNASIVINLCVTALMGRNGGASGSAKIGATYSNNTRPTSFATVAGGIGRAAPACIGRFSENLYIYMHPSAIRVRHKTNNTARLNNFGWLGLFGLAWFGLPWLGWVSSGTAFRM